MKRIFTAASAACILLAACSKTMEPAPPSAPQADETIPLDAAARANHGNWPQGIVFTEANLFPEGVVYDRHKERFYVSSTTRGDIGIVNRDGDYTPFITDPDLIATTGLEIDESRKLLYVSNSSNGSVGIYSTRTGQRVAFVDLKPLLPGAPVFINDVALDPQGNAYVTNSLTPVIYKISRTGTPSIFYQDAAFATPPGGFGFNGIEYGNSNGGYLLVALTATNRVVKFPLSRPASYNTVALDSTLNRPDGLLLSNDGKELVVVNNAGGGEGKVFSFASKNKWQSAKADDVFYSGPVFPTTATTDGKKVYVLYAYLNRRGVGQSDFTIKPIRFDDNHHHN